MEETLLKLAVNAITLGLTWLVGQRVIAFWNARQKRRESQLQLAAQFYSLYGLFRAVWKEWNDTLEHSPHGVSREVWSSFVQRSLEADQGMEVVFLKVASERCLSSDERSNLGNLRQAFQVLHERIRDGVRLSYGASENEDYLEFKRLATWFGTVLASTGEWSPPSPEMAFEAFREITHNKYESRWKAVGR